MAEIKLYGTRWCSQTRRSQKILDHNDIPYEWLDIDQDLEAGRFVEKTNRGFLSVPTIVFPDGSILVEPTDAELRRKLGL